MERILLANCERLNQISISSAEVHLTRILLPLYLLYISTDSSFISSLLQVAFSYSGR
jgi:hypothetical protein